MIVEEIKLKIANDTGIPLTLLTGETVEENIAQAKALLAYKRDYEQNKPKNTREQFKEWTEARAGIEPQDTAGQALAEIEEAARIQAGIYPTLQDGGSILAQGKPAPDGRTTKEQFAEWLNGL